MLWPLRRYSCNDCGEEFDSLAAMRKHRVKVKRGGVEVVECRYFSSRGLWYDDFLEIWTLKKKNYMEV